MASAPSSLSFCQPREALVARAEEAGERNAVAGRFTQLAHLGGHLIFCYRAERNLTRLRTGEGEFRCGGKQEIHQPPGVGFPWGAADDGDGVWDADRCAVVELDRAHRHGFARVFREEKIVGVGEAGVACAVGDGVFHGGVAFKFADAAGAPVAVPGDGFLAAPALPEHGVMREGGAVERLGNGEAREVEWRGSVRVGNLHAHPRGETGPVPVAVLEVCRDALPACAAIRRKDSLFLQVERAEQFVVPKDIAARRVFFADEEFGEAQRFRGLGVVARGDGDAGLAGEVAEDRFGVDGVVRAIDGEARRATAVVEPRAGERGEEEEGEKAAGHKKPKRATAFARK